MATKSDFAQKLLHDLRRRKEGMAAAQSSGNSDFTHTRRDAYGARTHGSAGSRQVKALESVGPKTRASNKFMSSTKPLGTKESSRQMVPYTGSGDKSSKHAGNLYMAITFALENGGKLTSKVQYSGNNPIFSFLQRSGQRAPNIGKKDMKLSNFAKQPLSSKELPIISEHHISEISIGVQKLNHVLRACSNGVDFDRYSVQVGKELLKGAMELEESLRMLVDLQEASDCMINHQRKTRITLLEEEEDDDEKRKPEQNQLDRPRFSFDKPFRDSFGKKTKEKKDTKMDLMAIAFANKAPDAPEKQSTNTAFLVPHKRTASHVPNFNSFTAYLGSMEHSSSTQSTTQKGRISNVIAKLMGLEELPIRESAYNVPKESSTTRTGRAVSKKPVNSAQEWTREAKSKPGSGENKVSEFSNIARNVDKRSVAKAEILQATPNDRSQIVSSDKTPHLRDLDIPYRMDFGPGLRSSATRMETKETNDSQHKQNSITEKNSQEKGRQTSDAIYNRTKSSDTCHTKQEASKDAVLHMVLKRPRMPEKQSRLRDYNAATENSLHSKKKGEDKLLPNSQLNSLQNKKIPRLQVPQDSEHTRDTNHVEITKPRQQAGNKKGSQVETIVPLKTKNNMTSSKKKHTYQNQDTPSKRKPIEPEPMALKNLSKMISHANEKIYRKPLLPHSRTKTSQKCSPDVERSLEIVPEKEELGCHLPSLLQPKDQTTLAEEKERRLFNKEADISNGNTLDFSDSQSPTIQHKEQNHGNSRNLGNAEELPIKQLKGGNPSTDITEFSTPEQKKAPQIEAREVQNKTDNMTTIFHEHENESQSLEVLQPLPSYETFIDTPLHSSDDNCQKVEQTLMSRADHHLMSDKSLPIEYEEIPRGTEDISKLLQSEHNIVPEANAEAKLTESEMHFKAAITESQLFLNTAEALFQLNIPISILGETGKESNNVNCKLKLDCGYEVMKRKASKQELTLHPCTKSSIRFTKISTLDDLIKQLCKDFKSLESYGNNRSHECDRANYLQNMLEKDIHSRDPDTNSLWDLGWNSVMFAFLDKIDIVKDVEKHMINGLLDEITNDLLHLTISG